MLYDIDIIFETTDDKSSKLWEMRKYYDCYESVGKMRVSDKGAIKEKIAYDKFIQDFCRLGS